MEILKIAGKESGGERKKNPEAAEMKENIIQRAKILLDENGKLSKKVLAKEWNAAGKKKILNDLSGCRVDTKETAEEFFSAAGIGSGFADNYKEAA
ncbi:MAG: hypothetical protein WC831_05015 [Parcubacteria group bacterium]|jgi:hypothetical protein